MKTCDQESAAWPEALDPLQFPLHGSQLIEASAGTGKTFTIAALYLRLVLAHGGENAYRRPLAPGEILVVTFTEAATEELRDRIRRRLAEAAALFRASPEPADDVQGAPPDALLRALRADYPPEQWPACARGLERAAEAMDEAAVSTIHAWCYRMLREHAFDCESLFTQTLESDAGELLAEVVRDYWRSFVVALDRDGAAELRQWWPGPEELQGALRNLLAVVDLLADAASPQVSLPRSRDERARRLAALKAPWQVWVDELQRLLDDAREKKQFTGSRLRKDHYDAWLRELARWCRDEASIAPMLSDAAKRRLTTNGLAEVWKESASAPRHAALAAVAELDEAIAALPDAREDILRHAARWIAGRFASEQARRAQMGFDDLLARFATALHGSNGERLAASVRRQFPVALIDEFQDTDALQYRIFDTVYRVAKNDADTALILIGDPKQAIYAFRGADIYTYLDARRACAGRVHTLARNFRSTQAMVAATNHCFALAERRAHGAGAFLFRGESDNPLPFVASTARGRDDELRVGGAPVAALTAFWLAGEEGGSVLGKGAYYGQSAAACASEIVRLLRLGQRGEAAFVGGATTLALRPADIAVLVNSRRQAEVMRGELARRGVRSVYLSDSDSVFASAEAAELQHWLAACAEPDEPRLLRSALATRTLAQSWSELARLQHDEALWEQRVAQFRAYRACWRRQGVLPMLRRLCHDFGVAERLRVLDGAAGEHAAANHAGERVLTNLLHLAELLQQASSLLEGEQAVLRHLAEQRHEASNSVRGDARQVRLESDADLVRVVTVHKSKGLEYPLVFVPFASSARPVDAKKDLPLRWHDAQGRVQLALSADAQAAKRADRERLAEDLRKLYVALTRARYATWVCLAPLAGGEGSAFGYLLAGDAALPANDLRQRLQALSLACPSIAVVAAPPANDDRLPATAGEANAPGPARVSRRVAGERWWIASYSALRTTRQSARGTGSEQDAAGARGAETAAEATFQETLAAAADSGDRLLAQSFASQPADGSRSNDERDARRATCAALHDFPRGAEAGTFLHDLLEIAANAGFASVLADPSPLRAELALASARHGWEHWGERLLAWLRHLLTLPLHLPPLAGQALPPVVLSGLTQAVAEMEFWLAVHAVDTMRVDALVRRHTLGGAPRPELQPGQLNGMLKGFIDLVFAHQGRYYVADYKSNWLGAADSAYTAEAMHDEILHARYDLQYALYLLALHRLLRARLADYDYDRHIGGAVYIFLRGILAPSQGVHCERPPRELIESLDALFARRGANAEALADSGGAPHLAASEEP